MVWIKDNITRTGKEVFYEAELIEKLKTECQEAMETYDKEQFYEDDCDIFEGEAIMANRIMTIIQSYEGGKMNKLYEYQKEAEIAIDNLGTEVFFANEILAKEDKVREVIGILQDLRGYAEKLEDELALELNRIQRECKYCIYYDFKDGILNDMCKDCINNSNFKDSDDESIA